MPAPAVPIAPVVTLTANGAGYLSQSGVDLNKIGNYTDTLALQSQTIASVQITAESGAFSAFQGALQGSIDGVVWETVSGKGTLGMGISSGVGTVDIYRFLRVYVTTPNGAALIARVSILTKTV